MTIPADLTRHADRLLLGTGLSVADLLTTTDARDLGSSAAADALRDGFDAACVSVHVEGVVP